MNGTMTKSKNLAGEHPIILTDKEINYILEWDVFYEHENNIVTKNLGRQLLHYGIRLKLEHALFGEPAEQGEQLASLSANAGSDSFPPVLDTWYNQMCRQTSQIYRFRPTRLRSWYLTLHTALH